jgi:hypothetical protein
MVINFGMKNQVVWCEIAACKASNQNMQNEPCTQLIKATSCVERPDAMIGIEHLSYFSSYQMLTMDKIW